MACAVVTVCTATTVAACMEQANFGRRQYEWEYVVGDGERGNYP
jgi:hypothetical protein